jgi:hypothetical protein
MWFKLGFAMVTVVCALPALSFAARQGGCLRNNAASRICVGDRVIDLGDFTATVVEAFSNGQMRVNFDGYDGLDTVSVDWLAKSVRCYRKFCENDRVIDARGDVGTVQLVFDNGKTKVKFDGYIGWDTVPVSDLSKATSCVRQVCVNSRVIDVSAEAKPGNDIDE